MRRFQRPRHFVGLMPDEERKTLPMSPGSSVSYIPIFDTVDLVVTSNENH